ncbi:MAG: Nif11-like leader peptide family RiPP precursor [Synergistaceae bacterium]|nr:Nif11-like leader peptide family RiPP precursor [Synergistaceae bacterium]
MTENSKKFLELASSNEDIKKELMKAGSLDDILKVASSHGIPLTMDDMKPSGTSELSEDEMKAVAGGSFCGCGGAGSGSAHNLSCECTKLGGGKDPEGGSGFCICYELGLGWN